jgi:hypothetical protein
VQDGVNKESRSMVIILEQFFEYLITKLQHFVLISFMEVQDISNPSIIAISRFPEKFHPRPVPLGSNHSIILVLVALFPMSRSLMRIPVAFSP